MVSAISCIKVHSLYCNAGSGARGNYIPRNFTILPSKPIIIHETCSNHHLDYSLTIFAVMGKTGVGKSSFIDTLGGRDCNGESPKICHGLDSCKPSKDHTDST